MGLEVEEVVDRSEPFNSLFEMPIGDPRERELGACISFQFSI